MKQKLQHLVLSTFLLSALLMSIGADAAEAPQNHCVPKLDSKRYLTSDFSAKYPRTVKFECTYECSVNGRIEHVTAVSNVRVNSMDEDASMVVCQGVKVKKVSWGYDFDGVEAFYAYNTTMTEMKKFAFENISQKNKTETEYLLRLKSTLSTVAATYKSVPVAYFNEASDILFKMIAELPQKTTLLDKYVQQIVKQKGQTQLAPTAESLVLGNIVGHAYWRIPSHKF